MPFTPQSISKTILITKSCDCNNKEQKVNPAIIHFTGAAKPLGPVYIDYECVKKVVPLFRIYDSASWDDIVNLPIGTITLKISD